VVQRDAINKSKIKTVVVCMITSTQKRVHAQGNVFLLAGEGGLREDSVVNVSLITHVNKDDLKGKIGTLRMERVQEIYKGIQTLLKAPMV
jgi:mRNA interferase MazF